jgi:uncharacterized phage protein (TIGR01671 family)
MREIKFRAWDKEDKTMENVLYINFDIMEVSLGSGIDLDDEDTMYGDVSPSPAINYVKFDDIELMQYTGLKDKNGEEIYEGDIVHDSTCDLTWAVTWNEESGGYGEPAKYPKNFLYKSLEKYFEVLGNIYENPELLS